MFSSDARTAAEWTMGVLAADDLARLRSLDPSGKRGGVELYHGSIRDPVWEYVIDDHTAAVCLELQGTPLSLVGHSHVPLVYGYAGDRFLGGLAGAETRPRDEPGPFLLNPGSVGQPRDGDPRAAYMTLDTRGGRRRAGIASTTTCAPHRRRSATRACRCGSERGWQRGASAGQAPAADAGRVAAAAARPRPTWKPSRVSSATTPSRAL